MPDLPPPLPKVGFSAEKLTETADGTSVWTCRLRFEDRKAKFEYRMGALLTEAPTVHDVLDSLLGECVSYEAAWDFDSWCNEFGIDTEVADMAAERRTYKAVGKNRDKVKTLLGDQYEAFIEAKREGHALQGPNRPMRIVGGGQGQFLAPPMHPAHHYHLEDGPPHNPNLSAGLDYALDPDNSDVPESMRRQVRQLFDEAQLVRSPLWEAHVYGYLRNCYSPDGTSRNVSDCITPKAGEQVPPPEHHLGYLMVKSYFPDAEPNLALIERSDGYGSRPCLKCGTTLQYEARVDAYAEPISGKRDCPEGGVHLP